MRRLLLFVLAACGGGGDGGADAGSDPWDTHVAAFAQAICTSTCSPGDPATCQSDVIADLGEARNLLDAAGQQQCLACLDVKASLVDDVAANGCTSTPQLDAMVYAACDLDPATDFDADGDPANDDDEACAGFP
jgi:hypothetical protein